MEAPAPPSSRAKFDPPESVVVPAFRELLDRLRRARLFTKDRSQIGEEERRAFEYGVTQRKRVLEHTLFLIFGQWALYRQLVNRLHSRALKFAYGTAAFMTTSAFVRYRAMYVSRDMFAHILTLDMDSSLGNEARIVLAELEGPDGPYFRKVCREKEFDVDMMTISEAIAEEGMHDVHPQLRLRPRLLNKNAEEGKMESDVRRRQVERKAYGKRDNEAEPIRVGRRGRKQEERDDWWKGGEVVVESGLKGTRNKEEDSWGKAFDFAGAAKGVGKETVGSVEEEQPERSMSPSQIRAFERQEKRRRAREKLAEVEENDRSW